MGCRSSRQFSFSFLLPLFLFPLTHTQLISITIVFPLQYYSQGELSFIHTRYQFSTIITCTCTIPTPNVRHNVTVSDLTPHWFTNMGFTVLHWSPLSTLLCFSSTANTPANAPHDIHTKNGVKHTPCNNIPQFFFPHGKPLPVVEQERKLRKVVVSENR